MFRKMVIMVSCSILFLLFPVLSFVSAEPEPGEATVSAEDTAAIQQLVNSFFTIIKQAYETRSDAYIDQLLGLMTKDSEYATDAQKFRLMMKQEIASTVSFNVDDFKIGKINVDNDKGFAEFSYVVTKTKIDKSMVRKIQSGGFQLKKEDGAWKIFVMGRDDKILEEIKPAQPTEPVQAPETTESQSSASQRSAEQY